MAISVVLGQILPGGNHGWAVQNCQSCVIEDLVYHVQLYIIHIYFIVIYIYILVCVLMKLIRKTATLRLANPECTVLVHIGPTGPETADTQYLCPH